MHSMTLTEKVRLWLETADLRTQNLSDCLVALRISHSTLNRALVRERTSYSALLDQERRRRVTDLLSHRGGKMQAWVIMIAAGYRHGNSAYRAVQRWYGVSIREYNKSALVEEMLNETT